VRGVEGLVRSGLSSCAQYEGLHRLKAEGKLVCMALNLRRMCALRAI